MEELPPPPPPVEPPVESAWERGLRHAKEVNPNWLWEIIVCMNQFNSSEINNNRKIDFFLHETFKASVSHRVTLYGFMTSIGFATCRENTLTSV